MYRCAGKVAGGTGIWVSKDKLVVEQLANCPYNPCEKVRGRRYCAYHASVVQGHTKSAVWEPPVAVDVDEHDPLMQLIAEWS